MIRVTIASERTGGTATSGDADSDGFELESVRPNPFSASTEVRFTVPEAGLVHLAVYDVLGREVAVLVDETVTAGAHRVRFEAGSLPSGTYLVRAQAGGVFRTRLITLVR